MLCDLKFAAAGTFRECAKDVFLPYVEHQLRTYLERNALITVDQSAYCERHNRQTALHTVLDDWYYNIADGLLTPVCSFDIKKCFDTINHSILFKKMENMDSLVSK